MADPLWLDGDHAWWLIYPALTVVAWLLVMILSSRG